MTTKKDFRRHEQNKKELTQTRRRKWENKQIHINDADWNMQHNISK
jgi:hypothetical protein